ncbi:MAG: hypothetical protein VW239_11885, partial [Candidatus Nanopelagicales bacterium]
MSGVHYEPTDEVHPLRGDKVTAFNWEMKGEPGEFQWISKNLIKIDLESYQRRNPRLANKIAKSWSWTACNAISVMRRGNQYYAVDGGTRLLAAKMRSDIKNMPCMVFESGDDGVVDEANAFTDINKYRSP